MFRNLLVHAAIVAYHPNIEALNRVLSAISPQVADVLLVANDGGAWSCRLPANVTLAKQDKNLGLGAAYNLAAEWAQARGGTHLLLLDQDSVPECQMVSALVQVFNGSSNRAAVAGPLWRDTRTGEDGFFVRLARWGVHKYRPVAREIVPVDFLISSGSLISLDALADIGPFDETFFIEHVDTDWVLRARAKGYRLYGVASARLNHAFGEATLTVSSIGLRRRFFLYPPERNYYLLRNSMALWHKPYAPWPWVLHDVRRTILLMLFYALFVPPRLERLQRMFRAMYDALRLNVA